MQLGFSLITIAVQVAVLGLMVVSMPLTKIFLRDGDRGLEYCFTLWASGKCGESGSSISRFPCNIERRLFQVAAAFSIISSVLSVAVLLLFIMSVRYGWANWASRIAAILCVISVLLVWFTVLVVYNRKSCKFEFESSGNAVVVDLTNRDLLWLGLGYSLTFVALVLEIVVVVLSFVF
ncbi:hypothetical protein DQ04_05591020 [Trypanosoma grayi]|uniref:hypothetical protein n=1 Tax=Trypanosoma grayi TaxID=71804 RepID=UPI0004F43558|nr:hypothetical protein DQ04_05591020 [Trypanosoma grayi]KEG09219.1 hypothetical protein DQ04_05591020 [Trypanosoma grayi]